MPDWIAIILLGVVEGLTEFLPVSSTGHLLLAQQWLPMQTDFFNTFIQCGALLAVLMVFWRRLGGLARDWHQREAQQFAGKLGLAFLITSVGGLAVKAIGFTLPHDPVPVALATLIGGILILVIERWLHGREPRDEVTWRVALALGLAQLVAGVFPGTSRSGATILTAVAFGVRRPAATEFSFLLGIPTLFAASGLEFYSLWRLGAAGNSIDWPMLLLGTAASAASAFAVVKWLLRFVQTHTFYVFGWYRILLGGAILLVYWPQRS
ncbi:MAG TPA: undecaprenyl-diphosphate phosphatase [Methylomirabilota bacterium]|nr:undecaprenyl-diphosphate phosphatase [Methylomirabilota bacterium]